MRALPLLVLFLAACNDRELGTFNSPPSATILSPLDGDFVEPGGLAEFVAEVGDGQTDPPDLTILWQSSVDGELDSTPPDASGNVYFATNSLSSGPHTITLMVVDEGGKSASTSIGITVGEGANPMGSPTITILNPTEGAILRSTETNNVIATVVDDIDAPDSLRAEIVDVPDGVIWSGNPSFTGNISAAWNFSIGTHTLTLSAIDLENKTAEQTVNFEVIDGGAPTINIISPASGSAYDGGQPIRFEATVGDDVTPVEQLQAEWVSDLQGSLSVTPPDSSGNIAFTTEGLVGGTHTITLKVTDSDSKQARKNIQVTINDPNDRDDDGDGWTENQGDCDDASPVVNPDMQDICDDKDNDCDGKVNGSDWDSYEENDSLATAYDFGDVGDSFWTNETVRLSGLSIHKDGDEDWYRWATGDIIIIDNVDIQISATGLPSNGDYVMELYNIDDGSVRDSDSGGGTLRIHYVGDWLDDTESDWALRIYAANWPNNSCSTTYSITITS